jgi:hypothetical protein
MAVEVGMRTLGNVQIDSRNGDIQLSLPDKAGFRLDARTRDGEIQSDFSELKVNNDEHEAKRQRQRGKCGVAHRAQQRARRHRDSQGQRAAETSRAAESGC